MANTWIIAPFCVYFLLLIGIAILRARKMRNMSDYVLGARRLGSFATALSTGSSTTSAWTMLSLPALAFTGGAVAWWIPASAVVGIWLSWTLLAKRLRRYTVAASDALTIPEFFEARFGDGSGSLRTLASLVTILFVIFYISSGLVGGSKLLETIFGVEPVLGILLTLGAVGSYTLIGGFLAVARTDVFQALLMLASLLLIASTLAFNLSPGEAGSDDFGFWNPFSDDDGAVLGPLFFLSTAGWAFGAFGAQRILQRFMALDAAAPVKGSRNIAIVWLIAVYGLALAVGLMAHSALAGSGLLEELGDPERVYLVVSEVFFHPAIAGLLLTAVIAAVMSTADSQLLLASAVASGDLPMLREFSERLRDRSRVWLGRSLLVVIGCVGAAIPIVYPESIFEFVSYAWGGMGAAFGPVTILALYWRRFNRWGAAASILAGTAVASLWALQSGGPEGIWDIQPATPGFFVALLVGVGVCLATPRPEAPVLELFDRVTATVPAQRAIRPAATGNARVRPPDHSTGTG